METSWKSTLTAGADSATFFSVFLPPFLAVPTSFSTLAASSSVRPRPTRSPGADSAMELRLVCCESRRSMVASGMPRRRRAF